MPNSEKQVYPLLYVNYQFQSSPILPFRSSWKLRFLSPRLDFCWCWGISNCPKSFWWPPWDLLGQFYYCLHFNNCTDVQDFELLPVGVPNEETRCLSNSEVIWVRIDVLIVSTFKLFKGNWVMLLIPFIRFSALWLVPEIFKVESFGQGLRDLSKRLAPEIGLMLMYNSSKLGVRDWDILLTFSSLILQPAEWKNIYPCWLIWFLESKWCSPKIKGLKNCFLDLKNFPI